MRNCPFHAVAQRQPEIVCEMNLALLGERELFPLIERALPPTALASLAGALAHADVPPGGA